MKIYKGAAAIAIHAPVEKIWTILLDIATWHEWDANFIRVEGTVTLGATVTIMSRIIPDRAVSVAVTELVPQFRMTWTSRMLAGECIAAHTYLLIPLSEGNIDFVTYEFVSGPGAATIAAAIPDMTESFKQFASALKQRAETP